MPYRSVCFRHGKEDGLHLDHGQEVARLDAEVVLVKGAGIFYEVTQVACYAPVPCSVLVRVTINGATVLALPSWYLERHARSLPVNIEAGDKVNVDVHTDQPVDLAQVEVLLLGRESEPAPVVAPVAVPPAVPAAVPAPTVAPPVAAAPLAKKPAPVEVVPAKPAPVEPKPAAKPVVTRRK